MLEPESEQTLLGLLKALDADDSAIHPGLAHHLRAQVVSALDYAHPADPYPRAHAQGAHQHQSGRSSQRTVRSAPINRRSPSTSDV